MAGDEALRWIARFARAIVLGAIDMLIIVAIFYYALPQIISGPQELAGATVEREGAGVVIVSIYLLSIAARALRGTVLSPVFRSSALVMGLLLTLSLVGSGVIQIEQELGQAYARISLDISPIVGLILGFIIAPSIVAYFIGYLLWIASRGR
ncbi:MAG: hypothetical protein F7B20_01000 [Aeropyrum sp.]|nr:hypothetical protein [Aeropyrum sp.]MCE4616539.1 hypothetical protein [Aeropyrum sp.]